MLILHLLYISSSHRSSTFCSTGVGSVLAPVSSVLGSHPDFTSGPDPAVPALTGAAVAQAVPCADQPVKFVTVPVVALAELPGNPPVLSGADAVAAVAGTFSVAHDSI